MKRYFGNEFNYDTYGERYKKKVAWTPENEDWFYSNIGGVPYNPQYSSNYERRFLRRHGIRNYQFVENGDLPNDFNDGVRVIRPDPNMARNVVPIENDNRPKPDDNTSKVVVYTEPKEIENASFNSLEKRVLRSKKVGKKRAINPAKTNVVYLDKKYKPKTLKHKTLRFLRPEVTEDRIKQKRLEEKVIIWQKYIMMKEI